MFASVTRSAGCAGVFWTNRIRCDSGAFDASDGEWWPVRPIGVAPGAASLQLPAQTITRKAPLPEAERIALLGRLLAGHDLPLRSRVAGVIVLLYAQPLSRIVRLTVDDLTRDGDQVMLRLGEPPSPVPAPVAELLLAWIAQRDNMNTATNPDSRWLFPGRRAGQPMHSRSLGMLVTELGVPITIGRTAANRAPRAHHAGTGGRRRPGLPPRHHHQDRHESRNYLEPLRPRRPHTVLSLMNP